jgi:precorrin-4 C11-methyltransferase
MKTAIILVSEAGYSTAKLLVDEYNSCLFSLHNENGSQHIDTIDGFLKDSFSHFDAFIFVGAMGICVRSIAPYIRDKHTDPAVVCVDSAGRNAISVLSGHIGGANKLTMDVAKTIGAMPVITTLTDEKGLWGLDILARQFDWSTPLSDNMNAEIALFASNSRTALLLEAEDRGTAWMKKNKPANVEVFSSMADIDQNKFELLLIVSYRIPQDIHIPHVLYVPRCLHVGIGLAHQASPAEEIISQMNATLNDSGIMRDAVMDFSTIEEKRDEPVVKLLEAEGKTVNFFSSDDLKEIEVPNPSDKVRKYMDTPSVAEASALLSANAGELLLPKVKNGTWTLAVAIDSEFWRHRGHVEIVGAGPGDPDLVSVRGRKMIESADLILYAGSLVPRQLTSCAKNGAVVRSSASMALEEQVQLMKSFYDEGKMIVRLHTGDPCLYGAIQEQMSLFDKYGMHYHITPGISAFQAAAAELRSQFTIPQKVQTIILTRGEGRTPMPDREKLHLLARSRSTMCIYLSADIVEKVQAELLQEYPADTPVAACYRLTWPEQRIYRGELKNLSHLLRDNNLTLDTLIVVGEAIDNRNGLSELYSKHFTHLFRKAEE